jgi:hypothetical protein
MEIWLRQEGVEYGPYTLAQVKEFVASGESVMEDEAWFDGCDDYVTVGDIPNFTSPRKVALEETGEIKTPPPLPAPTSTSTPPTVPVKKEPASPDHVDDFGLSLANPIPSSSINASYAYLQLLATPDKQRIRYERLGPRKNGDGVLIDHYSISNSQGHYICDIYINSYAGHDTEMAPQGLEYFRPLKGMFDRPENQKLKESLTDLRNQEREERRKETQSGDLPTTHKNQEEISGKPGRRRPIEIDAQSIYLVCKAIHGHLKPYLDDGWVCGDAVCLADDWRNEYNLTKGDQRIKLEFDLRPSLRAIHAPNLAGFSERLTFVYESMSLTQPQMDKMKERFILRRDRDALADQSFSTSAQIGCLILFGVPIYLIYYFWSDIMSWRVLDLFR